MFAKRRLCVVLGTLVITGSLGYAADPPPQEPFLLIGTLSEWIYPGSKFHGAESSDGAVTGITTVKSKATLTTPDPIEKVLAFYLQKLNVDAMGKTLGEKPGERITTKRAVAVQDNSGGRPLKLYVIGIHEGGVSTNLIISRSAGEETTHIAWSDFRQLSP